MNYTVYSKDNCLKCDQIKTMIKSEGKEYKDVNIPRDMDLKTFKALFPHKDLPVIVDHHKKVVHDHNSFSSVMKGIGIGIDVIGIGLSL
jgi:glutaredoxin